MSLSKAGFSLETIYDLPLDVFNLYVTTALRLEAKARLEYISDTTASVASLFSSNRKMKEYAESLEKQYLGEKDGRR